MSELLQYEFPNPFWTPCAGGHVPTWPSSPPHHVHTAVLLSYGIPQRKVMQELLLDLQRLPSAPQSINRAALSSCEALPCLLPIWVLSFWDRLSEAYITSMSWRRSLDWVDPPSARSPANQQRVTELDSLMHRLPWHGYIGGKRRDGHVDDVFDLLSNGELSSGQMYDLLELLGRRLGDIPDNRYLIAPTGLSPLILYSFKIHMEHTYQKQAIQQSVEEELVQRRKSAVASIAWTRVGGRGH